MELNLARLHCVLLQTIIEKGHTCSIEDLSKIFQRSPHDVIQCLHHLQEYHGVVLHPKSSEVWIIHPFSLAPTNFWVESARGKWWGNCAWCSLGVASLLQEDVTITTTLGGEATQIQFQIKNGEIISAQPLFVHFPIPMKNAWDNVIFTCSVMLIFTSDLAVDDWCQRHRLPKGDIQPIEKIWKFAQAWYGNHLREDWKKWTAEEALSIFNQFNLTNNIWQIPVANVRF
ncbi:unnamed protein product [Rotaria sp. Silwood2]|nr:unnamed protein product [Rotaria sp. Silwood2]CAF2520725.1 unnamed protein product [Rotaria sp. Silwood2]CAF2777490.1 unnamed protein product [Rotaria sp. Silwood2]CAF2952359.1 unnamed protein product [Rotaria sp. Silwood2]CAF3854785.1 unnamed protein product [Rotaria sp. Silwood2]